MNKKKLLDFAKINLNMPSKEDIKKGYMAEYEAIHKITDMNNWYEPLSDLTIPSIYIDLSERDIKALLSVSDGKGNENQETLNSIIGRVDECIALGYTFCKLNTRAPKDNGSCVFKNGHDAIMSVCNSMRTFEDLCMFNSLAGDVRCSLWMRQPRVMKPECEWRVFVRGGKICGITQYFKEIPLGVSKKDANEIVSICDHTKRIINGELNEPDYVFDMYIDLSKIEEPKHYMIEINPYGSSDPCRLTYDALELNA